MRFNFEHENKTNSKELTYVTGEAPGCCTKSRKQIKPGYFHVSWLNLIMNGCTKAEAHELPC